MPSKLLRARLNSVRVTNTSLELIYFRHAPICGDAISTGDDQVHNKYAPCLYILTFLLRIQDSGPMIPRLSILPFGNIHGGRLVICNYLPHRATWDHDEAKVLQYTKFSNTIHTRNIMNYHRGTWVESGGTLHMQDHWVQSNQPRVHT